MKDNSKVNVTVIWAMAHVHRELPYKDAYKVKAGWAPIQQILKSKVSLNLTYSGTYSYGKVKIVKSLEILHATYFCHSTLTSKTE